MPTSWVVVPTCLPVVLRRCRACTSDRHRATGKFRVNAHHKLLDAWLLARCTLCEVSTKITVLQRTRVRSVRPVLLDRLHRNDPDLVSELLQDPVVLRRNRIALDWDEAWRLDTEPSHQLEGDAIDVSVHFAARIPVRPVRLIADGLGLSRADVERLVVEGTLVSRVDLSDQHSSDFTFTFTC